MNCDAEVIYRKGKGPHAAQVRCAKCQRYVRWASKKEMQEVFGGDWKKQIDRMEA
jgi:hypothetical protein